MRIQELKIERLLGEGGMASVYEAVHIASGKKLAVKMLKNSFTDKPIIRQRFINEAVVMKKLQHPNIVKIYGYQEDVKYLAIFMELLQGESLTEYIKRKGRLYDDEAKYILNQILRGIDYAHKNGVVHRDIKPSNIFITRTPKGINVKVIDFGIAKIVSSDMELTGTGTQMGTPLYMSPEQIKDTKNIDNLTDIYSIGLVLFYMLKGKPPYDITTNSKFDIFEKIIYEKLPYVDNTIYNDVIQKATEKRPADRFLSCSSFAKALNKKDKKPDTYNFEHKSIINDEPKTWLAYYFYAFKKYGDFSGRARRKEFFSFVIFHFLMFFLLVFIFAIIYEGTNKKINLGFLLALYLFISFIPTLSVSVRRMHDAEHSGWTILIPFYSAIVTFMDGTDGENKYGNNPREND